MKVHSERILNDSSSAIMICTYLEEVIEILASGNPLPEKYQDHSLNGNYRDCRECHITPDWLLIYQIRKMELILYLTRTGTHSDLF